MNEICLFLIFPSTSDEVLEVCANPEQYNSFLQTIMSLKEWIRARGKLCRFYYDSTNIKFFLDNAKSVDEEHYWDKPINEISFAISKVSQDVSKVRLTDNECYYTGWDTSKFDCLHNIQLIVKSASEKTDCKVALLSFSKKVPTDYDSIHIIKDAKHRKDLPSITTIPLFVGEKDCMEWLASLESNGFSLRNRDLFVVTPLVWGKQRIYRKKSDGSYWYFDFFHKDNKLHYEVFDSEGKHMGEADMNGIVNYSKKDSNKLIVNLI